MSNDTVEQRPENSIEIAIFDRFIRRMGPYGFGVYALLCHHTDHEGTAFVGQKKIAEMAGLSLRTVKREVGRLKALGLIQEAGQIDGEWQIWKIMRSAEVKDNGPNPADFHRGYVRRRVKEFSDGFREVFGLSQTTFSGKE